MNEFESLCAVLARDDWQKQLEDRAIFIKWSEDNKYFLLQYNQIKSDFSDPVVRACRGIIFAADTKPFCCVCAPFFKFGNFGESYCPEIDWSTARVLEKIDGSLMKIWNYDGVWHLSTNGTINAYDAQVTDTLNFGDLFEKILLESYHMTFADFTADLDPYYTYMFEMTSIENQVVIKYDEPKIWFLSRRNMLSMKEDYTNDTMVSLPQTFDLTNLHDCLAVATRMSKDQEGMVVNDAEFNRIKIKSPEYLMAAHLSNNHAVTTKRIIRMIKNFDIDDFVAYCSEYTEQVNTIQNAFTEVAQEWEDAWKKVASYAVEGVRRIDGEYDREKRAVFAKEVVKYGDAKAYIFAKCDNPDLSAYSYMLGLPVSTLRRLIDKKLK